MFGSQDSNDQNSQNTSANPVPETGNEAVADTSMAAGNPMSAAAPADSAAPTPVAAQTVSTDELLQLKQEALQSLAPMVNQLDQTPEEKFKTLMMLIQASDNSALVKEAYATAKQIQDEKARAQALIDIVNEINYFTHKSGNF